MFLEQLRDFEWYNEPADVSFDERGMRVLSRARTDFWQSLHHRFSKDNGHFFFTRKTGNFSCTVKWNFETDGSFDQCGIMLRIDERNWVKASVMFENFRAPLLGTCVTNAGSSDWASQEIPIGINQIWYQLKRINGDCVLHVSLDGKSLNRCGCSICSMIVRKSKSALMPAVRSVMISKRFCHRLTLNKYSKKLFNFKNLCLG